MTRAPWDLCEALHAATRIVSWMENAIDTDDVPPEHIWHHEDRIEEWFAAVKQRRSDRAKGLEPVPAADDDDEGLTNELVKGLRD